MKKTVSLLIALVLVLAMFTGITVYAAESTVLATITDQAVTAGVPYVWTWTATGDGLLSVDATPIYANGVQYTAYKVNLYASQSAYTGGESPAYEGSVQVPGDPWMTPITDFTVKEGQYVIVSLYAMMAYQDVDGSVNATLSFTSGGVQKTESKIDYETTLTTGANALTLLNDVADNTLYIFTPDEIGIYTFTVSDGAQIGYWGANTNYTAKPATTASSFEREVKSVGESVILGISSEDSNVTLTIEKTGESAGIIKTVYDEWEIQHPLDASLIFTGALPSVDITEHHTAVKGDDDFYHLDSADGPVLYVDLTISQTTFDIRYLFDTQGRPYTMRGKDSEYHGYEFKPMMLLFSEMLSKQDGLYPLTEDLWAFLHYYGEGQYWYVADDPNSETDPHSVFSAVAEGGFDEDTVWMYLCRYREGSVVADPAPDTELTIPEAIELGERKDNGDFSQAKYYVTGVITEIADTTYGDMYIADVDGNTLFIYTVYDADGNSYASMETKPAVGDTVKLYGAIGNKNGTARMQNARIVEHTPAGEPDPACTHPNAVHHTAKASTHSENGVQEYWSCPDCLLSYDADGNTVDPSEMVILAMGHTLAERVAAVSATCTTDGNIAYYYCASCNANFEGRAPEAKKLSAEDVTIPALGHAYEDVVTAPTATEQGYTTHTCTTCGDSYVDSYTDPTGLKGDLNGDGKVNATDYNILARIVKGLITSPTETMLRNGDINGDGRINATDYNILARVVKGLMNMPA